MLAAVDLPDLLSITAVVIAIALAPGMAIVIAVASAVAIVIASGAVNRGGSKSLNDLLREIVGIGGTAKRLRAATTSINGEAMLRLITRSAIGMLALILGVIDSLIVYLYSYLSLQPLLPSLLPSSLPSLPLLLS